MFQIPCITAPFKLSFWRGLCTLIGFNRPHRASALIVCLNLKIPRFWYMFVVTFEMMPLNKPHDAIVNDVEDARFVEHFQHIFVF